MARIGWIAALATGFALPSCSTELVREACAFEARFRPAGSSLEAHRNTCLDRARAVERSWRPGEGSRPTDPRECLGLAHAGVERYRQCMSAQGWRELPEGRVPYAKAGSDARETAIASRRCAERSFEGSRYGPFTTELEACLRRRGWSPPSDTSD